MTAPPRSQLIGRCGQVADCVALFSLDQHACVPVDTHVWQIAVEHYSFDASQHKTLTPKVAVLAVARPL